MSKLTTQKYMYRFYSVQILQLNT